MKKKTMKKKHDNEPINMSKFVKGLLGKEGDANFIYENYTHVTLGTLIEFLSSLNPDAYVKYGITDPGSYRGIYAELAFEPAENVRVGDMLVDAKTALGATYCGYKGGEYTMNSYTPVWIDNYGSGGGMPITAALLAIWKMETEDE